MANSTSPSKTETPKQRPRDTIQLPLFSGPPQPDLEEHILLLRQVWARLAAERMRAMRLTVWKTVQAHD